MSNSTDSKDALDSKSTLIDSRRGFVGMMVTAASALAAKRVLDAPIAEAKEKDATICVANCVAPGSPGATACGLDLEPVGDVDHAK